MVAGAVLMPEYEDTLGHGFLALLLYMGSIMFFLFILKIGAVFRGVCP